jgi:hypothetical protein
MNELGKAVIAKVAGAAVRGPIRRIIVRRAGKGGRFARWLVDTFEMDGSVVGEAEKLAEEIRESRRLRR